MFGVDFNPGPIYFLGTDGPDTLIGTGAGDVLLGFGGNDSLDGGAGNDTIDGGGGTNRIDGGTGDDLIRIDRSAVNGPMTTPANGVVGGDGYDTLAFQGGFAEFHVVQIIGYGYQITDLTGGARTVAVGIEHLQFTDLDIWLVDPNVTAPVVSGVVSGATVEGGLPVSLNLLALASDPDPNAELAVIGLGPLPEGVSYDAWSMVLTLDPAAWESLNGGVTEVVTIGYQVTDGLHQTQAFAQVSITGENDAATFSGTSGAVTEEGGLVSGAVTVTDVDRGEAGLATSGVFANAYGIFSIGDGWSFRLDADALMVQGLVVGQSLVATQAISALDGAVGEIAVTIEGAADVLRIGGEGADRIGARSAAERIFGLGGADEIDGGGGSDTIDGGAGADRLWGGTGADRVIWDAADLLADGGSGFDTLVMKSACAVTLSAGDQIAGDTGITRGFEAVDAALCLDAVSLTGSDAANRLAGGYGDDWLAGGRGADTMTGGEGADSFIFAARSGTDHVTDFQIGSDLLVLQGRTAAQVSWVESAGSTWIDAGAGIAIVLDGVTGVTLSDFLF